MAEIIALNGHKDMSVDFKKARLTSDKTIIDAIKIIDYASLQIVLVVDEGDTLLGTVTDGDIRRAILNGISLEESVTKIMNTKPTIVPQGTSRDEMLALMTARKIHQLPVLDTAGHIVDLMQLDELAKDEVKTDESVDDVWVVLMLGGMGTRLMPLTHDIPKPMIEIGGKPLLETIIKNFKAHGLKNFYFSVNYKSEVIKDYFGNGEKFGVNITYLHEEKRMGTAGALSLLPGRPTGPLIIMNGDILTTSNFKQLVSFHRQNQAAATMCVREYQQQVPYGVVTTTGTKLDSIVEKPSQTYFVNAGIYVLDAEVLDYVPKDQYFDMPELFTAMEKDGKDSTVFPVREYWLDIGNLHDLERGRDEYAGIFGKKDSKAS